VSAADERTTRKLDAMTPDDALPAGYRATTCPRCNGPFACGVGTDRSSPCFCNSIPLSAACLATLRERYADCLCASCLGTLARELEFAQ